MLNKILNKLKKPSPNSSDQKHDQKQSVDLQELRIWQCLAAGAIGDAVGYRVEFSSVEEIKSNFPQNTLLYFSEDQVWQASDDTQMTLFTLEALTRHVTSNSSSSIEDFLKDAYLDWFTTQGYHISGRSLAGELANNPLLHKRQAPGNTCLSALNSISRGKIKVPINDSKGCGGVMRAAPIGFLPDMDEHQIFQLGAASAAITHGHPDGWGSAAALSMIVHYLLQGKSLEDAIRRAIDKTSATSAHRTTFLMQEVLAYRDKPLLQWEHLTQTLGLGWTGDEALAVGLYCALKAETFDNLLLLSSCHSGDSDSTASIAAQIWTLAHSFNPAQHPVWQRLDLAPVIDKECFAFNNAFNQVLQ